MKKAILLLLCVVTLVSMFAICGTVASAATPSDVMYVKNSAFVGGQATFDVYLRKNISLIGTIVKVVYDPNVLEPVSGGAHSSSSSANGIFVADKVSGINNAYSMAFVSMDSYSVGSKDKAFFTLKFKVKGTSYPQTSVKFYCVEFNSTDTSLKIEKNDANPPQIGTITTSTLNQLVYKSIAPVANGIKIEWNATPGATRYVIYKYDGESPKQIGETTSLSYTDTTARVNVTEKYIVRAFNGSVRDSGYSTRSSKLVIGEPVAKVKAVSGGVNISWNDIEGATQYYVYRKYNGAKSWTCIAKVSGDTLSYTDKAANSGRNIFYTVRAVSSSGKSSFTAKKIAYVAIPHITKASNGRTGITIRWGAINNADGYRVYRRAAGEKGWKYQGTTKNTSWTDKNVKSNVVYKYTVRTVFRKLYSGYESGKMVRYIAPPKMVAVKNVSEGIYVDWNSVAGANSYRVYRRAAGEKSWTYMGLVNNTQYTDKSVKNGVTYRYTVRALTGKNGTGWLGGYEAGLVIKCR